MKPENPWQRYMIKNVDALISLFYDLYGDALDAALDAEPDNPRLAEFLSLLNRLQDAVQDEARNDGREGDER